MPEKDGTIVQQPKYREGVKTGRLGEKVGGSAFGASLMSGGGKVPVRFAVCFQMAHKHATGGLIQLE